MVHNPLASRTVRCEQCEAARAVRCEPCEDARAVRCEQCEDAFKDTELDERIQRYGDTNHTHDGTQRYTMAGRDTVQDERTQRYFPHSPDIREKQYQSHPRWHSKIRCKMKELKDTETDVHRKAPAGNITSASAFARAIRASLGFMVATQARILHPAVSSSSACPSSFPSHPSPRGPCPRGRGRPSHLPCAS